MFLLTYLLTCKPSWLISDCKL